MHHSEFTVLSMWPLLYVGQIHTNTHTNAHQLCQICACEPYILIGPEVFNINHLLVQKSVRLTLLTAVGFMLNPCHITYKLFIASAHIMVNAIETVKSGT